MIRTFCDICGKELNEDHSNQVNVTFHAYGLEGFVVKLKAHTFKDGEINLCVGCADSVVSDIEDLKLMRGVRAK